MEASNFENTLSDFCFVYASFCSAGTYIEFDGFTFKINNNYFVGFWPSESKVVSVNTKSFW